MTLKKLVLIVRRRWLALVSLAVLGLALGALLTTIRNRGIEPLFEANASVVLVRQNDDDSGRQLRSQLSEFQRTAIRVNQGVLATVDSDITTVEGETEGFLVFVGRARTDSEARDLATSMRTAYLEAAPIGVQAVEQDLADLAAAIDEIRTEIADLVAEDEINANTQLSGEFVSAAIGQLRSEAVSLAVDLILFDLRDDGTRLRSELESELETLQTAMSELQVQYDRLGLDPVVATDRDLRIMALEQQEGLVTQQYLELFLNQAEVAALTSVGAISVDEISDTPIPASVAGVGGLILATLVGLAALLLYDFVRGPIWALGDLESTPSLGTLAPRGADMAQRHFPWYMHADSEKRLSDVQRVRAAIQNILDDDSLTVGMVHVGVSSDEVKTAAADLGASLTAIGRGVLMIDTEFGTLSGLPEYGPLHPTLADLLRASVDSANGQQEVKKRLAELVPAMPRLRGMSAGYINGHPADVLAGPAFRTVLRECREIADVVILAGADSEDPAAAALTQLVDRVVVVAKAESTRLSDIEGAVDTLKPREGLLAGVLLLEVRHGAFGLRAVGRWLRSLRSRGTRRLQRSMDRTGRRDG